MQIVGPPPEQSLGLDGLPVISFYYKLNTHFQNADHMLSLLSAYQPHGVFSKHTDYTSKSWIRFH